MIKKIKLLLLCNFVFNLTLAQIQDYGIYYSDAYQAIITQNTNKLEYLLEISKDCYLDKEILLQEAIFLSKSFKSADIIKTLIKHLADANKKINNINGHHSAMQIAINHALFDDNFKAINYLLESGVKILKEDYIAVKESANLHPNNKSYIKLVHLFDTLKNLS